MEKGVPIRSISRSLATLTAVNRFGSLTMTEIAREISVPYPTACRIVQTLIYEGFIELEDGRKRYRPTALVASLAHGFQRPNHLIRIAKPHIRLLTEKIGWPVTIASRVGRSIMLLDTTFGYSPLSFGLYHAGFTLPLLESAAGKLSLAYCGVHEREAIYKWIARAENGERLGSKALALQHQTLDRIVKLGYAAQASSQFGQPRLKHESGTTSAIAVPILANDSFCASLTVVFFSRALKISVAVERYLADLQKAASHIGTDFSDTVNSPQR